MKHRLTWDLDHLRRSLGMSCAVVAKCANLSLRTVQRVLSGAEQSPELSTIIAIAGAMGAALKLDCPDAIEVKTQQAKQKADRLVAMTQGTSALEAQALPEAQLAVLRKQTMHSLLGGSPRRLWAEE